MELTIRKPKAKDLPSLQRILERWVIDDQTKERVTEDINDILDSVRRAIEAEAETRYRVAEIKETVIGMVGLRPLTEPKILPFATTNAPFAIVHFYVSASYNKGKGVGRRLLLEMQKIAREAGGKELLVNSGRWYKDTGWGFYDKMFGERVTVLKDFYGKNSDAPVWRKPIG